MHKANFRALVLSAMLATTAFSASATTVNYALINISGNTWQYTYTVSNDTLAQSIDEFTVYFDGGLFDNLTVTGATTPSGWDPVAIQPDTNIPADGFYDALALGAGISSGNSLGGFQVSADFLGAGTPGDQYFEIVDPLSFTVVGQGFTQAVPMPDSIWLMLAGLATLVASKRVRSRL